VKRKKIGKLKGEFLLGISFVVEFGGKLILILLKSRLN
jgi:hypothetical protein